MRIAKRVFRHLRAARAIAVLVPKFAFIENVPTVIHDQSDVVGATIKILRLAGYNVTTAIVDMQVFGLPQRRRRHILFAARHSDVRINDLLATDDTPKKNVPVGLFIDDLEEEPTTSKSLMARPAKMTDANVKRIEYLFANGLYDLPDKSRPPCHRDKEHSYQSVYGRLRWDKPSQTITSGFGSMGQGRYVHPRHKRLITPHEAARIQGFPDFYDFSGADGLTALRKMIGNAVPPPVMIQLAGALFDKGLL